MPRLADPGLAERRRRQILDAALRCFGKRGFHQTSMAEICAEAGLSAGALYRYFGSKTDIIAAIADDERRGVAGVLHNPAVAGAGLVDQLVEIAAVVLGSMISREPSLIADVLAEAGRDKALAERLTAIELDVRTQIVRVIGAAEAQSGVRCGTDPEVIGRVLMATVDGLGLRLALKAEPDTDRALNDVRALLVALLHPLSQASPSSPAHAGPQIVPAVAPTEHPR